MVVESQNNSHNQRGATPHSSDGGLLGRIAGFFMRDGSLSGLAREAVKDVQHTFHQAAWGHGSQGGEPGAPLTPLHKDIEEAREFYSPRETRPSPGDIARGRNFTAAERQGGTVHGQTQGTVHGKGNAQYAMGGLFGAAKGVSAEGLEAMPEAMPEPAPMPEPGPAPEPAPAGEGTATQGQAPRGSGVLDRLQANRGFKGGNSDEGVPRTQWLEQQRNAQQGGGGAKEQGRTVADEQKQQNEPDGPSRGGRSR